MLFLYINQTRPRHKPSFTLFPRMHNPRLHAAYCSFKAESSRCGKSWSDYPLQSYWYRRTCSCTNFGQRWSRCSRSLDRMWYNSGWWDLSRSCPNTNALRRSCCSGYQRCDRPSQCLRARWRWWMDLVRPWVARSRPSRRMWSGQGWERPRWR